MVYPNVVTRNNLLLEYREFDGLDPNTADLLRAVR
jgi:hypothetical protein